MDELHAQAQRLIAELRSAASRGEPTDAIPEAYGLGAREEYRHFIREWVEAFPGAQIDVQRIFEGPGRDVVFGVSYQQVRSPERSMSQFGFDLADMRKQFVERHAMDPGPVPDRPETKVDA